ncbi:MAG: hypothetical protein IKY60_00005 [Bacteroidales bacterium]|nr:hypothetical protein [Bacteroidales bacterium]
MSLDKSHPRLIIYISIVMYIISSCNSEHRKIRQTLRNFSKLEISIPDNIQCIYNKTISAIKVDTMHSYKFIIFYDWNECSSCKLSAIKELIPIYKTAYQNNCSVIMIFSPHQTYAESLISEVFYQNIEIPIYIDTENTFKLINPEIPSDPRFHYFLIDDKHHPIFIGNPISNKELWDLFTETLRQSN